MKWSNARDFSCSISAGTARRNGFAGTAAAQREPAIPPRSALREHDPGGLLAGAQHWNSLPRKMSRVRVSSPAPCLNSKYLLEFAPGKGSKCYQKCYIVRRSLKSSTEAASTAIPANSFCTGKSPQCCRREVLRQAMVVVGCSEAEGNPFWYFSKMPGPTLYTNRVLRNCSERLKTPGAAFLKEKRL